MNYTFGLQLNEEIVNSGDIHSTTSVLGNSSIRACPKVYLDRIAGDDTPNTSFSVDAREA